MKHYSASEARNRFGEIIEESYHTGETVIVERRNKPFVAIVPLSEDHKKIKKNDAIPSVNLGQITGNLSRKDIYEQDGR